MKQLTDTQLINLLSVTFGVTLITFGFLVRYYRNEIQRLFKHSELLSKGWKDCSESWNETINEVISRGNKILELVNSMNILKNQNIRYSKICRRLYDENQNLKLENQQIADNWSNIIKEKYELNVENQHLQEKIVELEKGKLKEKRKR